MCSCLRTILVWTMWCGVRRWRHAHWTSLETMPGVDAAWPACCSRDLCTSILREVLMRACAASPGAQSLVSTGPSRSCLVGRRQQALSLPPMWCRFSLTPSWHCGLLALIAHDCSGMLVCCNITYVVGTTNLHGVVPDFNFFDLVPFCWTGQLCRARVGRAGTGRRRAWRPCCKKSWYLKGEIHVSRYETGCGYKCKATSESSVCVLSLQA